MTEDSSTTDTVAAPAPATAEAPLDPILNRTIPGPCHPANQDTVAWGPHGLLAYGCHSVVVVVEPVSVQVLQCLSKHRSVVCSVKWSQQQWSGLGGDRRLVLASADMTGNIITWDLVTGEHLKMVSDGNQEIQDMAWLDATHLMSVHPPNHIIMWDMNSGAKVWKKSFGDTILSFDISPFKHETLLLRCQHSFLLTEFSVDKCPKSDGKKFFMINPQRDSVGGTGQKKSRNKLRKMVRSMMLGEEGEGAASPDNDSVMAIFHPGVRGQVVIGYSKEVLIVDMELGQAVGGISFDRSNSSLVSMVGVSGAPWLYLLHESGSVSVWGLREGLSVAATPSLATPIQGMTTSLSLSSMPAQTASMMADHPLLEISYECLTVSDHIRLAKNCRVSGLAVRPVTETECAFTTTDGRLVLMSLRPASMSETSDQCSLPTLQSSLATDNVKLTVSAVMPALGQVRCVKMCPPLTTKNLTTYRPLLAVGTVSGHVQIVNMSTGLVEREIVVHAGPVQGLEWTSSNPAVSLLSFSHTSVTGAQSGLVRNELAHVNILTGKVKTIRSEQGKEAGEAKITLVKVSHARKFFIVAFSHGPFELWDLTKLSILRTMPRKFPLITALEWSPGSSKRAGKSGSVSPVVASGGDGEQHGQGGEQHGQGGEHGKEYVVMTDADCQLYHFTVHGHTIKDGTKIPAETGLGTVTSICWKGDLIVRGCTEGNVNIWNMKARQNKNIHTGRGAVKRMCFSPGKNNMKLLVLFETGVQIWDVKELEMINELRTPLDSIKMEDIEWASSDRVVLAGQDGMLRLAGLALAGTTSHCLAYGRHQEPVCPALLPKQVFRRLAAILSWRPADVTSTDQLRSLLVSQLSGDSLKLVSAVIDYCGDKLLEFLLNESIGLSDRLVVISLMLGLDTETEMWTLCRDLERGQSLGRKYGFLTEKAMFLSRQDELCRLHGGRAVMREDRMRLTAGLIVLGHTEAAVAMLMEQDPDTSDTNTTDQLLACLITATAQPGTNNQAESIMKMVATNLVSEGKMWEGVQLLVLSGKVKDACSYLRSGGYQDESMVVGRCLLDEQDWKELVIKYANHHISHGRLAAGVSALLTVGQYDAVLDTLLTHKLVDTAHRLLLLLHPNTGHNTVAVDTVMQERVATETVKMMADIEYREGFEYYCDKLDQDKASQLKSEFNISSAA